jgi:hypothetical protein
MDGWELDQESESDMSEESEGEDGLGSDVDSE